MISLTSDGIYTPHIKIRAQANDEINSAADTKDLRENLFAVLRNFPEANAAVIRMLEEKLGSREAARKHRDT